MSYHWTEDLSVNDATLDDHHKKFFDEMRSLDEKPIDENDTDRIAGIFDFLEEHINRHFKYEEDYMYNHGFPDLPEHKKLHENFIETYETYKSGILGDNAQHSFKELQVFIKNWVSDHIRDKDHRYAVYIETNPESHPENEMNDYHTVVHF